VKNIINMLKLLILYIIMLIKNVYLGGGMSFSVDLGSNVREAYHFVNQAVAYIQEKPYKVFQIFKASVQGRLFSQIQKPSISDIRWMENLISNKHSMCEIIIEAVLRNKIEIVNHLLNEDEFLINGFFFVESPLSAAVEIGNLRMVQFLIDRGANVNLKSQTGETPLALAVQKRFFDVAQLLIERGSSIDGLYDGDTLLHTSASKGDLAITELLLRKGIPIDMKNSVGRTPLFLAIENYNLEVAQLLIDKGAVVHWGNQPDSFGITKIHRWAREGDLGRLHLFLKALPKSDVVLNPAANFFSQTLEHCYSVSGIDDLNLYRSEEFADPLIVVQNFCDTFVRMKDGRFLLLINTSAQDVYRALHSKRNQVGTYFSSLHRLTVYLSPGHAFLELDDDSFGFYPSGRLSDTSRSVAVDIGSKIAKISVSQNMRSLLSAINTMARNQCGYITKELEYKYRSDRQNQLKLVFYINATQAGAVRAFYTKIDEACKQCESACYYNLRNRNCVDFAQQIADQLGSNPPFSVGSLLAKEQLRNAIWDPWGNKAVNTVHYRSLDESTRTAINCAYSATALALGAVVCKITKSIVSWVIRRFF